MDWGRQEDTDWTTGTWVKGVNSPRVPNGSVPWDCAAAAEPPESDGIARHGPALLRVHVSHLLPSPTNAPTNAHPVPSPNQSVGATGDTPLMAAAGAGHREITALLIERGAVINYMNSKGFTALMRAAMHGNMDVVTLLCTCGADPTLVRTPASPCTPRRT